MSVQALSSAMTIHGVSSSEKLLLLVLANYADERMTCWPSHKRMAADTCLSERTVLTLLKSLEEKGLISRQEQRRQDGSRTSDRITLALGGETISPRGETGDTGVGKSTTGGGEMVSPLTTFEPSINHQKEPSSDPDGFDAWWAAYPRKDSRGTAVRAYRAALKKAKPQILLAALMACEFSPERRFQPLPATWLNGERWLDGAPSDPPARPPDDDPWPRRIREFERNGFWNTTDWGPKPGRPDCKAPQSLLERAA